MTRFATLVVGDDGKLTETDVREIKQSDIGKCPHVIFVSTHYRDDGSCRCDDPEHVEMRAWGYKWHDGKWR